LYATLRPVTKCVGVNDNTDNVVIMSNMKATLLLTERHAVNKQAFAELLVWKVPVPLRGSAHLFKYSLAISSWASAFCVTTMSAARGIIATLKRLTLFLHLRGSSPIFGLT
jgi:hypothetical protein